MNNAFIAGVYWCNSYDFMIRSYCRYVVQKYETQATFSGAQQRAGVYAHPYNVEGLFGLGKPKKRTGSSHGAGTEDAELAAALQAAEASGDGLSPVPAGDDASHTGTDGASNGAGGAVDDDDAGEKLPSNFRFDWDVYRQAFGSLPLEKTVTSMFAQYAVLYARIWRNVGPGSVNPMTINEGEAIQSQAERFILKFCTPLLRVIHTTNVHRLLRHVIDAVRWHGNVSNGNTAENESAHKNDKSSYVRTNKDIENFTFQLVRHAQGSREVLGKHKAIDAERAERIEPSTAQLSDTVWHKKVDDEANASVEEGQIDGASPGIGDGRTARGLPRVTVGELSKRPGLYSLQELLGMEAAQHASVLSRRHFSARYQCGT